MTVIRFDDTASSDEHLAQIIAQRRQSEPTLRAARGACDQLYVRHAGKLLAFLASRVSRNDLEDVHQVVWERVWQYLPEGFRGGNFRAWLYQIARNYLIDLGRKPKRELINDAEERIDPRAQAPEELLIERERIRILNHCLEGLGTTAAKLVSARLAGESYTDICQRLELKPEQAHKLFHRAKEQLQTCVERALP